MLYPHVSAGHDPALTLLFPPNQCLYDIQSSLWHGVMLFAQRNTSRVFYEDLIDHVRNAMIREGNR